MEIIAASFKDRILYQNNACMVINKLPGESSGISAIVMCKKGEMPSETGEAVTSGGKSILFPVHRLDTPVSGCLLLAKTRESAAFLSTVFAGPASEKAPAVEKRYWAIVEKPKEEHKLPNDAELIHWLYENKKINKSFAYPFDDTLPYLHGSNREAINPKGPILNSKYSKPKKAVLRYRIIGEGEFYLFLEIRLVTGRHHQIRAQLAALGLFIKGDLKYGAKRSEKGGGIRLHASSLIFPNPLDPSEAVRVKAPPPVEDSLWRSFAEAASTNNMR